MSFKLAIACATLIVVSCARLDNEQLNRQMQQQQQEMVQQQNDLIRDHHRLENQQRETQLRELEDQRRRQEQIHRDQEQKHRDIIRNNGNFIIAVPHQTHFLPASYQIVTVPSSRRSFEYADDSNYNFAYAVNDMTTGDFKSQHETRNGDQVQGQYTMMDSDGYQRTVEYRADDQNGFDAEVRREPVHTPAQLVRLDGHNSYAPQYFHQPAVHVVATHQPTIYSTTSVSRRDDGQRSQYSSSTASNF
jgi:Insect cuticle protein